MFEFITALQEFAFLRYALIAGILASISCGIVGAFVVTKRISYLAGAISHFVLGGIGIARYLNIVHGWTFLDPMYGAVIFALLAAIFIGYVRFWHKQREDTIIGVMWAVGMAVGVMFISQTPGYNEDLMTYLFGNILLVTAEDLRIIAVLDVIIVVLCIFFYRSLVAICFDEHFAKLRGIKVRRLYILLLCLTAMTVVLLVTVVGIVMVIALLTIPAGIASQFAKSLGQMMLLATLLSIVFVTSGLGVSYQYDVPSGATIIIISGIIYVISAVFSSSRFRFKN
ncbi:metal ABC transporter permease [Candidatus Uabimicrobium amorphum]|uniref:Membrane protein n=1 Tax=Uabimicrobium amorphum TaxID=2596890 RepID=A0A5S9INL0_UABAM|nr:metal ABC transporter permease [Candidatus Uabimicrobium amorphum]BBM84827.1 membrane protein [Candidatus Uabimicrobium amorphum]